MLLSVSYGSDPQPEVMVISPRSGVPLLIAPGSIITLSMLVTNRSAVPALFMDSLQLPAGWKRVIAGIPFRLPAGEAEVRLIAVSVPMNAPARPYRIRCFLQSSRTSVRSAPLSIPVTVLRVDHLLLDLHSTHPFVIAGTSFPMEVTISNTGNARNTVRFTPVSSHGYTVRMDSSEIHLGPGEQRSFQLIVGTDASAKSGSHTLELEAETMEGSSVSERTSIVTEIVRRSSEVTERYREFPIVVRSRAVGMNSAFGIQAEVSGYGPLNDLGSDRLEFLLRFPGTQSVSGFGLRDEYRIAYRTGQNEWYAGDRNYILSPLTESGRMATGVGGTIVSGRVSGVGFFDRTRWGTAPQEELGGSFSYRFLDDANIGINMLRKRDEAAADIISLRSILSPLSGTTLDIEGAAGTKDGRADNALAARLEGTQRWLAYDLRFIRAGPQFGGYFQDMKFISASISAQASRDIRFLASLRHEQGNLGNDTAKIIAPLEQHLQIGAGYAEYASLFIRSVERKDRFDIPSYRTAERAVQVRVGNSFTDAAVFVNAEAGVRYDRINARSLPFERLSLYTNVRPSDRQSLGLSLDYETTRDSLIDVRREHLSANMTVFAQLGQWSTLHGYLFWNRMLGPRAVSLSVMETSLEHRFRSGHIITARGRVSLFDPSAGTNETSYALEYSVPLLVPYAHIVTDGQLRGTVKDGTGTGIAGVLLVAGSEATVTGDKGEFFFPSLLPGPIFLGIDRSTIGVDRTTQFAMPLPLIIRGGEETMVNLIVTASAVISGRVYRYEEKERSLLDSVIIYGAAGGMAGVFLELTGNAGTLRRVTDNKGEFVFEEVQAGRWILKVVGGDLPEFHHPVPDSVDLIIIPGARKDIGFGIYPEKRTLQLLH